MKNEPPYLEIISIIDTACKDYKKLNAIQMPELISNLMVYFSIVFGATFLISALLLLSHVGTAFIVKPIFLVIFLLTLFTYISYLICLCRLGYQSSKRRGIGNHATKNRIINDIELLKFIKSRIDEKNITENEKKELLVSMEYRMSSEPVVGNFLLGLSGTVITASFAVSKVLGVDISQYVDETIEWYGSLIFLTLLVCGLLIKLYFVPQWARYIAVIKFTMK